MKTLNWSNPIVREWAGRGVRKDDSLAVEILRKLAPMMIESITKCKLTQEELEMMVARRNLSLEFVDKFMDFLPQFVYGGNPYACETDRLGAVQSYSYPEGWRILSLEDQLNNLKKLIPDLSLPPLSHVRIPEGFDDLAIIPKLSFLGRKYSIEYPFSRGYQGLLLNLIKISNVSNTLFINGLCGPVLEEKVSEVLFKIEGRDKEDCLILPVSLGKLYAGYSPRNARTTSLAKNQLPLGSVQTIFLLVGSPGRLARPHAGELIYCPGEECYTGRHWGRRPSILECPRLQFDGEEVLAGLVYQLHDEVSMYSGGAVAQLI